VSVFVVVALVLVQVLLRSAAELQAARRVIEISAGQRDDGLCNRSRVYGRVFAVVVRLNRGTCGNNGREIQGTKGDEKSPRVDRRRKMERGLVRFSRVQTDMVHASDEAMNGKRKKQGRRREKKGEGRRERNRREELSPVGAEDKERVGVCLSPWLLPAGQDDHCRLAPCLPGDHFEMRTEGRTEERREIASEHGMYR